MTTPQHLLIFGRASAKIENVGGFVITPTKSARPNDSEKYDVVLYPCRSFGGQNLNCGIYENEAAAALAMGEFVKIHNSALQTLTPMAMPSAETVFHSRAFVRDRSLYDRHADSASPEADE